MSEIERLLTPDRVKFAVKAKCKREVLSLLADLAAESCPVPAGEILKTLQEREQLGSTGVGAGIAIPHGKVSGIDEMFGSLVHLAEPVEFDAVDDQPVDLLFLLLAPENASAVHLKTLSRVARLLRNEETRASMRGATSADALYAIALEQQKPHAA